LANTKLIELQVNWYQLTQMYRGLEVEVSTFGMTQCCVYLMEICTSSFDNFFVLLSLFVGLMELKKNASWEYTIEVRKY
jgi:hypothetical protein